MSSKSRPVDYGGIVWKVVPGSRREQLLLRFIEQDKALKGVVPDVVVSDWQDVFWLWIGVAVGASAVGGAWWLL